MSIPLIVTHPSPLLHSGLRQLFAKSQFRPVRVATTLTPTLKAYLVSLENAVWLTGIEESFAATNLLLRKIISANSHVKAVVMASSQKAEKIVGALKAGACGYMREDVAGEILLASLQLIARDGMIVHPQLLTSNGRIADHQDNNNTDVPSREPLLAPLGQMRNGFAGVQLEEHAAEDHIPSLSRREMLILSMLMQGASNKTIALKLVITESTVKVHMKAVLRKLRLQNRTQAAIWARNNVDRNTFAKLKTDGFSSPTSQTQSDLERRF